MSDQPSLSAIDHITLDDDVFPGAESSVIACNRHRIQLTNILIGMEAQVSVGLFNRSPMRRDVHVAIKSESGSDLELRLPGAGANGSSADCKLAIPANGKVYFLVAAKASRPIQRKVGMLVVDYESNIPIYAHSSVPKVQVNIAGVPSHNGPTVDLMIADQLVGETMVVRLQLSISIPVDTLSLEFIEQDALRIPDVDVRMRGTTGSVVVNAVMSRRGACRAIMNVIVGSQVVHSVPVQGLGYLPTIQVTGASIQGLSDSETICHWDIPRINAGLKTLCSTSTPSMTRQDVVKKIKQIEFRLPPILGDGPDTIIVNMELAVIDCPEGAGTCNISVMPVDEYFSASASIPNWAHQDASLGPASMASVTRNGSAFTFTIPVGSESTFMVEVSKGVSCLFAFVPDAAPMGRRHLWPSPLHRVHNGVLYLSSQVSLGEDRTVEEIISIRRFIGVGVSEVTLNGIKCEFSENSSYIYVFFPVAPRDAVKDVNELSVIYSTDGESDIVWTLGVQLDAISTGAEVDGASPAYRPSADSVSFDQFCVSLHPTGDAELPLINPTNSAVQFSHVGVGLLRVTPSSGAIARGDMVILRLERTSEHRSAIGSVFAEFEIHPHIGGPLPTQGLSYSLESESVVGRMTKSRRRQIHASLLPARDASLGPRQMRRSEPSSSERRSIYIEVLLLVGSPPTHREISQSVVSGLIHQVLMPDATNSTT